MARYRSGPVVAGALVVLILLGAVPRAAPAAGLNTDVALTPPRGGTIVRVQGRYSLLSDDPTPLDREARLTVVPVSVVHGLTEDFVIFGTLPIVHQKVEFGSGREMEDTGLADVPLLAKYRFYQRDESGRTTRWALIGGAEIPTYDDPFSSESLDPVLGTVWTHQRLDWWIDWDLLYKLNTAGGLEGDDEVRGDVALSYRLLGGQAAAIGAWGLYAVAEVNALYIADGSWQVFGSPGLQLITPRWILEAGVQLPLEQEMASPRLETDFTAVASVRFQF